MDNYHTPTWIKEMFDGWYDPCPYNPKPSINGLLVDWKNKTYVNPPYSNPLPWVVKAIEERDKGKTVALLLKLDTTTKWYYALEEANAHIMFIGERVKFNGRSPPFCNILVILEKPTCEHDYGKAHFPIQSFEVKCTKCGMVKE